MKSARPYRPYNPSTPYFLMLPMLVILVLTLILPIFYAIYLSMTDSNMLTIAAGTTNFVGLANYRDFIASPSFGKVMFATFVYVVLGVALTFFTGLGAALLLNRNLKGGGLFKALVILPWAVPQVVLVILWKWMLNPQYGVVNYLLAGIGLIPLEFSWFSDPRVAIFAIMLVTVWKQYPLSFLILLAGLKTIPDDLYEAAAIDGAGRTRRFLHITWPGLRPVRSVLVLLLTVWAFTNFVIIWLMTKGGPADRTATLSIYSYLNSFKFNKLGYGAAIGVCCLLLSLVFSAVYYRVFMHRKEEA